MRWWAFWRRLVYVLGISMVVFLCAAVVYSRYFYVVPNCQDGTQNGDERGIDCGGSCSQLCAFDITPPSVLWSRAFEIRDGVYNAVAYVENKNLAVGTPEIRYTFSFYDTEGLVTTRSGSSVLPPDSVYPLFEGRIETGDRKITQTFLEIDGADMWLPIEKGREHFVIENRELINADSEPRLDATITNTLLIPAKDVEIVATIFDVHGNALTASRTVVPNFPPRTAQDVVFTWPEPIAKTVRSCEVPSDVMMLIDLSGSMNNDGGNPPQPITATLDAATSFVSRLKPLDQSGVITFATEALLVGELSTAGAAAQTIPSLVIDPKEETGATNIGDPLNVAVEEFNSSRHNKNARKVIVLLTDGLANAPVADTAEMYALDAALKAKDSDITVFTIGLGSSVNREFLTSVASSPEHVHFALNIGTLDQVYQKISNAICEDGAAVIEIVPKTTTSFEAFE